MANKKNARRAVFTSVMSLILCCAMLMGTTFAWFTDNVTSGNNIIKSGNLDIELEYSKDASTWNALSGKTDLFSDVLWEPGHTEVVYLKLSNKGTLALNYQFGVRVNSETEGTNVAGETFKLSDYIQFGVVENQSTKFADRAAAVAAVTDSKKLNEGYTKPGSMLPDADDAYMALVVYMPESVGNDANHKTGTTAPQINLGIEVLATQKTSEQDSFGPDYDVLAQGAAVSVPAPANGEDIVLTADNGNGQKVNVASFTIPAAAIAEPEKNIEITITPINLNDAVPVEEDEDAATYEITVTNLEENNTTPIKVKLQIGTGRTGVRVFHNATEIENATYNPSTGWVSFETTSFSPYTVVYDADPVVEDEGGEGGQQPGEGEGGQQPGEKPALPVAEVVRSTEYENTELPWGNYDGWSPTEGLEANLEAAYTFTCADVEGAEDSYYADWHCDFYVSLNRDLGENQIFLGGNYGSFGWVGFHNGTVTLSANEELPLLGSVTNNPWTYADIANFVGTFICGVGDVNDALVGATFTVKLRLTNPEDKTEFYDVATINYTFADTKIDTAAELQTALNAGGEVKLGGNIDLANTQVTVPAGVAATLNLNGYNITGDVSTPVSLITNNGNLTVAGNGEIAISFVGVEDNTKAVNAIANRGTLVVDGGTIKNTGTGSQIGYAIDNYNGATLTVNNGTITASGSSYYDGIRLFCGSNATAVTVNNGTISTIWAQNPSSNKATEVNGTVIVNGGSITTVYYENYTTVKVKEGVSVTVTSYGAGTSAAPVTQDGYTVYSFAN